MREDRWERTQTYGVVCKGRGGRGNAASCPRAAATQPAKADSRSAARRLGEQASFKKAGSPRGAPLPPESAPAAGIGFRGGGPRSAGAICLVPTAANASAAVGRRLH